MFMEEVEPVAKKFLASQPKKNSEYICGDDLYKIREAIFLQVFKMARIAAVFSSGFSDFLLGWLMC